MISLCSNFFKTLMEDNDPIAPKASPAEVKEIDKI